MHVTAGFAAMNFSSIETRCASVVAVSSPDKSLRHAFPSSFRFTCCSFVGGSWERSHPTWHNATNASRIATWANLM